MPAAVLATLVSVGEASSAPPPPNVLQIDLAVDIDYVDPALSGRIVSQSRRPGARLARGTRVNVVVSRGRRR